MKVPQTNSYLCPCVRVPRMFPTKQTKQTRTNQSPFLQPKKQTKQTMAVKQIGNYCWIGCLKQVLYSCEHTWMSIKDSGYVFLWHPTPVWELCSGLSYGQHVAFKRALLLQNRSRCGNDYNPIPNPWMRIIQVKRVKGRLKPDERGGIDESNPEWLCRGTLEVVKQTKTNKNRNFNTQIMAQNTTANDNGRSYTAHNNQQ